MFLNLWQRVVKQHSRPVQRGRDASGRHQSVFRPNLEILEGRVLLTNCIWTGASGIDFNWSRAANWDTGVPLAGDTAVFNSNSPGASVVDADFSISGLDTTGWVGTLSVNRNLTLTNDSTWAGGNIFVADNFTLTNNGTLSLTANAGLRGNLNNAHIINHSGGWLYMDHSRLTNTGTYALLADGIRIVNSGDDSTLFLNQGTILTSIGHDHVAELQPWALDNRGTIQVDSGTLYAGYYTLHNEGSGTFVVGGTLSDNDGVLDLGAGSGYAVTLTGTFTGSRTGTGRVQLWAATLNAENVNFNYQDGVCQWRGATIDGGDGGLTVADGSYIDVAAGGLLRGNLYNAGYIRHTGGWLDIDQHSMLTNSGTYEFHGDSLRIINGGSGSTFINQGTILNSIDHDQVAELQPWTLVNQGTIQVDSGTLYAGYYTLNNEGSGRFDVNDGVLDLGAGSGYAVTLTGRFTGSRTGTGHVQLWAATLNAEDVTFDFQENMCQWRGATIDTGARALTIDGYIEVAAGGLLRGALNNDGIIRHTGGGLTMEYSSTQNSTLTNYGSYEFLGDDVRINNGGGAGVSTFLNQGAIISSGANSLLDQIVFSNAGTLTIKVGSRFGVRGDYTQLSSGKLEVELGGTQAGQYGQMVVTGAVNLAGTLTATPNGYSPMPDDRFPVLTYGSRNDDFDTPPEGFDHLFDDINHVMTLVAL
jgi:hypothetical protein